MLFTVTQYLESVLNSRGLTRTLGEIDVCRTADGRPVFHTGNSAVIFRIRLDGRDRLLKCYTRPHRHLEAIYGDRFRPAELFLYTAPSEGMWADVVVDDWIEGETLTRTLDRAAANGDKLLVARLATAFDTLAARLLPAQWAHGDLKPDNLIWDGQRLRPIDFDGMFLPEFRGRRSPELGTHAFQHPARTEADFDASLDDYPAALIATVLHAAAHDPSLLVRYPAEGLVLDPSAVIEGRSEAYREMLDAFARRGDAVGYRTAQLLRSPVAKLPQAASLFAWRLRPAPSRRRSARTGRRRRTLGFPLGRTVRHPARVGQRIRFQRRTGGGGDRRTVALHRHGGPRRPQLPALRCREAFPQRYGRTAQRPAAGENRTSVEKLMLKRYICRLEI